MEDYISENIFQDREIPPTEIFSTEAINENFKSYGRVHSSSEISKSGLTIRHQVHIPLKEFEKVLKFSHPTIQFVYRYVHPLYLLSTRLETVPDLWTNTRRFMISKPPHFCRIPKLLVNNGIIRQTLKFISKRTLHKFHMKLELLFKGKIVDEWQFKKGWVYEGVITRWETTFNPSEDAEYFDPKLTARTILKTKLYDGDKLLSTYDTFIIFA